MKRILIDVNSILPYCIKGSTVGVGRTTFELVTALSKLDNLPFELMLFTQNMKGISTKGIIPLDNMHFYLPNRPIFKEIRNRLHLQTLLSHYDLIHIPHNTDIVEDLSKTIFTIHDLIVYHYPEMWNVTPNDLKFFEEVAQKSRAIITCSDSSKNDIIKYWHVPEEKVTSIPWGVNQNIFQPRINDEYICSLGIKGLYYFSAACNHPRKNLYLIVEGFVKYLNKGGRGQLVLLNPLDLESKLYENLVGKKKIIVCRNLSDEELVSLYSGAKVSIVASSYEGFGLPVLESLACGTQVVCAKNSSLKEAGGNIVDYLEELNSDTICKKLLKYENIDKEKTLNTISCSSHLSHFTWVKCAERYVETYQKLLYDYNEGPLL